MTSELLGPLRMAATGSSSVIQQLPGATTELLLADLLRCLDRPLEPLIQDRRLAFCFPDPPLLYPSSMAEVDENINKATLVLQGLESLDNSIGRLCLELALLLGRRVTCSAYFSRPESAAFGMHYDEYDVGVVQLKGVKVFDVNDRANPVELPSMGEFLFIPSRMLHRAMTVEESVHLSIGVH